MQKNFAHLRMFFRCDGFMHKHLISFCVNYTVIVHRYNVGMTPVKFPQIFENLTANFWKHEFQKILGEIA